MAYFIDLGSQSSHWKKNHEIKGDNFSFVFKVKADNRLFFFGVNEYPFNCLIATKGDMKLKLLTLTICKAICTILNVT